MILPSKHVVDDTGSSSPRSTEQSVRRRQHLLEASQECPVVAVVLESRHDALHPIEDSAPAKHSTACTLVARQSNNLPLHQHHHHHHHHGSFVLYLHPVPALPSSSRPPINSPRRPRSSHSSKAPRLGAISEDNASIAPDLPPQVPSRAHSRPLQRMFHLGFPPVYSVDGENAADPADGFHDFSDVKGPRGENFQDLRHNRLVPKRGGWVRLAMIGSLAVTLIVALGAGLGVGLARRDSASSSSRDPSTPPPPPQQQQPAQNQTFPLGSYTFPTYLSSVLTDCTPNPSTWSCFPYRTYNSSATTGPADSLTTFDWVISSPNPSSNPASASASASPSPTYQISSTRNPFALSFANQSLVLTDAGSDDEAYTFDVAMDKVVVPNTDITRDGDGAAARCLFNRTRFRATLYTRRAKTYPPPELTGSEEGKSESESDTTPFQPWPYAVEISQTIASGAAVPECYKSLNGQLGERIELAGAGAVSDAAECACEYLNYGT
ncbi:hypothetical protein GJ744_007432 [Endocarpon pusillum]|uniref:Tat pathway signal sequence n=1 Tax=Endocarpon pusillum TaxID=364733 RepID=A0A8H7AMQ7_9EURO|nr:hypothetical protein GJ744_007432 [Endocarpon pusillum]